MTSTSVCQPLLACPALPLCVSVLLTVLLAAIIIFLCWVLPIMLGVNAARRKSYSPYWMWFGIHPVLGWAACIFLLCATPRIQCPHCGGFVTVNFRICPYCHAELGAQANRGSPPPI